MQMSVGLLFAMTYSVVPSICKLRYQECLVLKTGEPKVLVSIDKKLFNIKIAKIVT